MRAKPPNPKEQAKRAALNALKRARRAAEKSGVELSEWEGEFLTSVAQRVETYGRAFADPEKGARGQALSGNQAIKLREIAAKAKGDRAKGDQAKDDRGRRGGEDSGKGARKPMRRGGGFGRAARRQTTPPDQDD